ncbi:integrase core domain-containing protein [Nocardia pseudobrasiliensis]|uniref:integrase core domain-containing protein n=1 Tax=Nocardia pseudobrasiliensis TaxID=45979 RepID=UPI0035A248BC
MHRFCTNNGVKRSLGRTGSCFDNAVAESFFATYKKELVHTRPWPTLKALKETFDWIEFHYNAIHPRTTPGWLAPRQYE